MYSYLPFKGEERGLKEVKPQDLKMSVGYRIRLVPELGSTNQAVNIHGSLGSAAEASETTCSSREGGPEPGKLAGRNRAGAHGSWECGRVWNTMCSPLPSLTPPPTSYRNSHRVIYFPCFLRCLPLSTKSQFSSHNPLILLFIHLSAPSFSKYLSAPLACWTHIH